MLLTGQFFPARLTLNQLNFLNGIIHLQFLELTIIIFRDLTVIVTQQYRTWSDSTIMTGLGWLYTGGKDFNHFLFQQGKV